MTRHIRQETPADYRAVSTLIQAAYRQVPYSDKGEQLMVLGHATFYPRFGYQQFSQYAIELPIQGADENSMIKPLQENVSIGIGGKIIYATEFLG